MTSINSIRFGREICNDLQQAERREWWLSNGLGGYAAGTIAGTLTRRYHGLLIAPIQPPLGRALVFAKADAWLIEEDYIWPLCTNRWPGNVIDPSGYQYIESFALDGRIPVWRFAFGSLKLEMRIWLQQKANIVYIAYKPEWPDHEQRNLQLHLRLLVNARDHHGDTDPQAFTPMVEQRGREDLIVYNPAQSGMFPYQLNFRAKGGFIQPEQNWHQNFELPIEAERGLNSFDHHLCVGQVMLPLNNRTWKGLTTSLEPGACEDIEAAMLYFRAADDHLLARAQSSMLNLNVWPDWIQQLVLAADSFLFRRPLDDGTQGESVIAGYPWFGDWGRDTMIALPGLTLATGRYDSALAILKTYARYVSEGMLPNVFPGAGDKPAYNSADAALWYIEAWRAYLEVSEDWQSLRQLFPVLQEIIRCYRQGTYYGITMDEQDGLLKTGEQGTQVTWMDAKVDEWIVTPRIGKPVEINALWYNALEAMAWFAEQLQLPDPGYKKLASATKSGFQRFINFEGIGLFDVLDGPDGNDASIRPNQILAVSLTFSPLTMQTQQTVVSLCGDELLTSYGLRSLAKGHVQYVPLYQGGVRERDGAYHQGTVWAWLLGHYALAVYRISNNLDSAFNVLKPMREHLFDAGLGTVSEIFDAESPYCPRGAPAQAWSVACILEAWWRLERERQKIY